MYDESTTEWLQFVAQRLVTLRVQKGVSAREMSGAIGASPNYINSIENCKTLPSMTSFFIICEYLGVEPGEFFQADNVNPTALNIIFKDIQELDESSLAIIGLLAKELKKRM